MLSSSFQKSRDSINALERVMAQGEMCPLTILGQSLIGWIPAGGPSHIAAAKSDIPGSAISNIADWRGCRSGGRLRESQADQTCRVLRDDMSTCVILAPCAVYRIRSSEKE